MTGTPRPAVFLDRDGVLIEDVDLLTSARQLRLLPGTAAALRALHERGFALVVVTNQTVVARGLASLEEVAAVNHRLAAEIVAAGGPLIERFYLCPHHPRATLPQYRLDCLCRKPRPGLILQAAADLGLDLARSFFVGDRVTDVIAGARAGCRTILVETGAHTRPAIESPEVIDPTTRADHVCASLEEAAAWVLSPSDPFAPVLGGVGKAEGVRR